MADSTGTAFVRLHLCVGVHFDVGGQQVVLNHRAGALLTGSRTSVVGGRVVIRDIGRASALSMRDKGVKYDMQTCSAMTFVDNIYTFAYTAYDALCLMQIVESALWNRWGLKLGAASKMLLDCSDPLQVNDVSSQCEYKPVLTLPVLGAHITYNGSIEVEWQIVHDTMWRRSLQIFVVLF